MYVSVVLILILLQIRESRSDIDIGFIIRASPFLKSTSVLTTAVPDAIASLAQPGMRIGLVVFGQRARVSLEFNENNDPQSLRDALLHDLFVNQSRFGNTSRSLYIARTQLFNKNNGDREDTSNLAVLITDDTRYYKTEETIQSAQDLHREGIRVVSIGMYHQKPLGPEVEEVLRAISSPPHIQDSDWYNLYFVGLRYTLTDILNASIIEASTKDKTVDVTTVSSDEEPKTTQEDQMKKNTHLVYTIPIVLVSGLLVLIIIVSIWVRKRNKKWACSFISNRTSKRKRSKSSAGKEMEGHASTGTGNIHVSENEREASDVYEEIIDGDNANGSSDIAITYDDVVESVSSAASPANGEGIRGQEPKGNENTYEQLVTTPEPLTFASWITKNNLSGVVGKKLKRQKIATIPDLLVLTERDIEDLGLTIGERSRLRAALKTLINN